MLCIFAIRIGMNFAKGDELLFFMSRKYKKGDIRNDGIIPCRLQKSPQCFR
jgi:hypothetical protein